MIISVNVHAGHLKSEDFKHIVFTNDDGSLDFITLKIGDCSIFVNRTSCKRIMVELRAIQAVFDAEKAEPPK